MSFDAHIHCKNTEKGGFLIGLEGKPFFKNTLSNAEVMALHAPAKHYWGFYYVSKNEISKKISSPYYLKYHPRREKYTPQEVMASIALNEPKCVMIDTLNEPYWTAYDYWTIARALPHIPMIFAHAGGYLINDFIKICHFQKNVWIDFALTHTVLGHYADARMGLPYVNEAIRYSLHGPFKDRVLMSSDYPFFDQQEVFAFYKDYIPMLDENFLQLEDKIK